MAVPSYVCGRKGEIVCGMASFDFGPLSMNPAPIADCRPMTVFIHTSSLGPDRWPFVSASLPVRKRGTLEPLRRAELDRNNGLLWLAISIFIHTQKANGDQEANYLNLGTAIDACTCIYDPRRLPVSPLHRSLGCHRSELPSAVEKGRIRI